MKKEIFWGIDISKNHLDICILSDGNIHTELRVNNAPSKISMAIEHLLAKNGWDWQDCIFCMENTGIYGHHLTLYLSRQSCKTYVVPALQIKRSIGLVRGKNDRVDASRIAYYIRKHHEELLPYKEPGEGLRTLKALLAVREQFLQMKSQVSVPIKEHAVFSDKKITRNLMQVATPVEQSIKRALKEIDAKIKACIHAESELKLLFKRATSVPGVGPVLGAYLLVVTQGFTRLVNPKKLACYCGTAPFEHSSGSSIRGRVRVSHFANKRMKSLLHLGALTLVRLKGELGDYYRKKVAQGKNGMLVLNALRNKIISRVCAVIRNKKMYVPRLVVS